MNLPSLLKFAQVENVESLAPVWSALGEGTKKEERMILQAALDDFSLTTKAATNAKLVIDKSLCNTMVSLMMSSGDSDRLDEGIQPEIPFPRCVKELPSSKNQTWERNLLCIPS